MNRPEFDLIDWIRSQVQDRPPVTLGIGDDAALLAAAASGTLIAIDMLMEGVHFTLDSTTPELAGRKSLAVNLSDIAAMQGQPPAAFVSVALPQNRGMSFARQIHAGILDLANKHGVVLAGGDTNSWKGPLVISVTVCGTPLRDKPVCRNGARPGDWIFVTGALGGSLISGRHLSFEPRLRESRRLSELVSLHSMIDISDGFAADLHHILNASDLGADVVATTIPLTETVQRTYDDKTALLHGLSDGEDFELLFTVAAEDGPRLQAEWDLETPLTKVGMITQQRGCRLIAADGSQENLLPIGWTHSLDSNRSLDEG